MLAVVCGRPVEGAVETPVSDVTASADDDVNADVTHTDDVLDEPATGHCLVLCAAM